MSEIVPEASRSTVYALDRVLEGTVAAVGAPAMGYLADNVFHWKQV